MADLLPPEDGGSSFVRITNREVYDRLGGVEAKLDDALRQLVVSTALGLDQGKRIRALELKFYGVLAGLIGAIAVLVSGTIH